MHQNSSTLIDPHNPHFNLQTTSSQFPQHFHSSGYASLQNKVLPNQLSLNVLKTEYMYFASDYNLSNLGVFEIDPLKIGEQPLTRVQSSKSRGVVFDQRLVWEEHVDSLCKGVSSGLAALKQSGQYVPLDGFLTIYNAVILPLFDYCDVVWSNLKKSQRRDSKSSKVERPGKNT